MGGSLSHVVMTVTVSKYERGYLVPNEFFFVRDHTRTPSLDMNKWHLKV